LQACLGSESGVQKNQRTRNPGEGLKQQKTREIQVMGHHGPLSHRERGSKTSQEKRNPRPHREKTAGFAQKLDREHPNGPPQHNASIGAGIKKRDQRGLTERGNKRGGNQGNSNYPPNPFDQKGEGGNKVGEKNKRWEKTYVVRKPAQIAPDTMPTAQNEHGKS